MIMQRKILSVSLNEEYEKAKARLGELRENYSTRLEEFSHLNVTVRQHLLSSYIIKLGQHDYEIFAKNVEIMRLKRKISLVQAAINQGITPQENKINETLNREFQEFIDKIKDQQKAVNQAENYHFSKKMSDADAQKLKLLYRKLARQLHPDLNPDLPETLRHLWQNLQDAYNNGDLLEMEALDNFINKEPGAFTPSDFGKNCLELLLEQCKKIDEKLKALEKRMEDMQKEVPFTYRELLHDSQAIKKRRKEQLDELAALDKYKQTLEQMLAKMQE